VCGNKAPFAAETKSTNLVVDWVEKSAPSCELQAVSPPPLYTYYDNIRH